jgi:hypothetical protein
MDESEAKMERPRHEYDEDGCCIHCGFDGAEWSWLRLCVPKHERGDYPKQPVCTGPRKRLSVYA